MKRAASWMLAVAFPVFLIDWAVLGLKLLQGSYNITVEAYIGLACCGIFVAAGLMKALSGRRCPHCGKPGAADGKFCPYCGKAL